MKIIVTAGQKGTDIDVFACAIAYTELLRLEGKDAIAVIPGAFTASVTPSILGLQPPYQKTHETDGTEQFVLVDISDPKHFASFVDHEKISEVYDHRYGHESYWQERLGVHSHIEMVGSCGTIIWEQFKTRKKDSEITPTTVKLLLASIVSNNLALKSELTTDRDITAYNELKNITDLGDKWVKEYYLEQETSLFLNFKEYVEADTKTIETPYGDIVIGQLEIWNGDSFIEQYGDTLKSIMTQYETTPWFVNISIVSDGYNYLFSSHAGAKEIIESKLHISFIGDVAKTDRLLMRKYLMKVFQS